jgi:four helix bundle protein
MDSNLKYKTKEEFKKALINRAFVLAKKTIKLTNNFPDKKSAWILTDQLLRAVTSIGANIIEAQAASSKRDFINFINYALKSANETKFWFALSRELDEKLNKDTDILLTETKELAKILGSAIANLKGKRKV